MSKIWGIHAGRTGDADDLFLQRNYIALGWNVTGDLSKLPAATREAFKANIATNYPESKQGAVPVVAGQLYRFVYEVEIGDLVCYFSRRDRQIHIGRVTSAYLYDTKIDANFPHLRTITWLQHYPRTHFTQTGMFELSSSMAFFRIRTHEAEFRAAAEGKAVAFPVAKPPSSTPKIDSKPSRPLKLFVSYRRKSWPFTHRLAEDLNSRINSEIFIDISGIDETDFEHSILTHLHSSNVVLVVLSELTFVPERIHKEDDWVRREIAMALEESKQIILINIDNEYLPKQADLPENIRDIVRMQAIAFYPDYWDAAITKLVEFVSVVTHIQPNPTQTNAILVQPLANSATLKEAINLLEAGDYERAIFLLNTLRDAGFKSRVVNIEEVLESSIHLQDIEAQRREAQDDYDNIVALASSRVMLRQAQIAWAKFQKQYPNFEDDVENLAERLGQVSVSKVSQVAEPSEETTRVLADRHYKRREFWTGLLDRSKNKTNLGRGRSPNTDHWLSIASGRAGIHYNYLILIEEAGIDLNIDVGDYERNKAIFDILYNQRVQIEAKFGEALDWRRMDTKRSSRIVKIIEGIGSLNEPEKWPALQETMIDAMIRLDHALRPRIAKLQV
ncbi:MAG: DUF4268 domain-containing protein [Chloroflexota bacterium]